MYFSETGARCGKQYDEGGSVLEIKNRGKISFQETTGKENPPIFTSHPKRTLRAAGRRGEPTQLGNDSQLPD